MNLDELSLGQVKELMQMMSKSTITAPPCVFVGQYCIARCYSAGVHAGEVVSVDGENVVLKDSRRLWSWKAKDGLALSGVAQNGLAQGSKVDVINPRIYLTGVCELIPVATGIRENIHGF